MIGYLGRFETDWATWRQSNLATLTVTVTVKLKCAALSLFVFCLLTRQSHVVLWALGLQHVEERAIMFVCVSKSTSICRQL